MSTSFSNVYSNAMEQYKIAKKRGVGINMDTIRINDDGIVTLIPANKYKLHFTMGSLVDGVNYTVENNQLVADITELVPEILVNVRSHGCSTGLHVEIGQYKFEEKPNVKYFYEGFPSFLANKTRITIHAKIGTSCVLDCAVVSDKVINMCKQYDGVLIHEDCVIRDGIVMDKNDEVEYLFQNLIQAQTMIYAASVTNGDSVETKKTLEALKQVQQMTRDQIAQKTKNTEVTVANEEKGAQETTDVPDKVLETNLASQRVKHEVHEVQNVKETQVTKEAKVIQQAAKTQNDAIHSSVARVLSESEHKQVQEQVQEALQCLFS